MLIEAITQTTESHVYTLTGNDDINIGAGVRIESLTTDAITTWQGQHSFTVSGQIVSHDDGINTIGTIDAQTVVILAGGSIVSGADGVIPESDGVILDGINSTLVNYGTITSHGSALSLFVHDGGTTTITNNGFLLATKYGVWNKFGGGALDFTNTGTIESPLGSFRGGDFVDHVTNSGTMRGNIDLGGGNDVFIGTGGTVVGSVSGGNGDDRFVLGTQAEMVNGGDGIDSLDFSGIVAAIRLDLTGNVKNRGAVVFGDTYSGIETVLGGTRNDTLIGDAMDNTLVGNAGSDRLQGGAGQDVLDGGLGRDHLTGGAGGDVFVFNSGLGLRDYILDFDQANDKIQLEGSAFGYDTFAGGVSADDFVSSTANAALDLSDRFIFRTSDATLWFDRDGLGGAKAIMIVDLQAGAILDVWNLLIS